MIKSAFSTKEAASLAELSARMLDYLCRIKVIVPSLMGSLGRGRGKTRRYSFGDVVLLRTYARLLAQGVSVKRLKEAHLTWSRHYKIMDHQAPPNELLITDGSKIFLRTRANVVQELTKDGQFAFAFIVDIGQIYREVRAKAETR